MEINEWNILLDSINKEEIVKSLTYCCITESPIFLLDMNKENKTLLENFVFQIALFHFKRLNIEYNETNYYVEFWLNNRRSYPHCLHIDCDENERIDNDLGYHPILSTITYLNESNIPTLFTDINELEFKSKNKDSFNLSLMFPKILKHISFNGEFYHGPIDLFNTHIKKNRQLIAIGLWERKPKNTPFFDNKNKFYKLIYNYQKKYNNNDVKFKVIGSEFSEIIKVKEKVDVKKFYFEKQLNFNGLLIYKETDVKEFILSNIY